MKERSGGGLLRLPVRLHGIQLGQPSDLLLDREAMRAVGIDVACGDEIHRFLPFPTAAITDEAITISSPLVLLEGNELDFYRSRAFALSSLRGRAVERKGTKLVALQDIVIATAGELTAVLVEIDGATERVPFDDKLRFAPERRSAA